MHMITDWMPRFHPRRFSHRILYVGLDHALTKFLQDELEDCQVVRSPNGSIARLFIEKLEHAVLLFDEQLPDTTGRELASFVRSLPRRKHTPIIILSASNCRGVGLFFRKPDEFDSLVETVVCLLNASARE